MKKEGKPKHGRYIGKDLKGRKIYFARQNNISKVHSQSINFIKEVFGIEVAFLSDESSLRDFLRARKNLNTIDDVVKRVKKIYKIDISPAKDKPLFMIVKFIKSSAL